MSLNLLSGWQRTSEQSRRYTIDKYLSSLSSVHFTLYCKCNRYRKHTLLLKIKLPICLLLYIAWTNYIFLCKYIQNLHMYLYGNIFSYNYNKITRKLYFFLYTFQQWIFKTRNSENVQLFGMFIILMYPVYITKL